MPAPRIERFIQARYFRASHGRGISRIVLHITDGQGEAQKSAERFATMTDGKVASAHYVVGQAGEIFQCVRDEDVAFHAHAANGNSIGIENCARSRGELGPSDPGLPMTAAQYTALVGLVRWLCDRHGMVPSPSTVVGHAACDPATTHSDCPTGQLDWSRFWSLFPGGLSS